MRVFVRAVRFLLVVGIIFLFCLGASNSVAFDMSYACD